MDGPLGNLGSWFKSGEQEDNEGRLRQKRSIIDDQEENDLEEDVRLPELIRLNLIEAIISRCGGWRGVPWPPIFWQEGGGRL
jgi:hypothetical protein